MKITQDFKAFLIEYQVIGFAVAFIIGTAITKLIDSLVANILLPFLVPFIKGDSWEVFKFALGPVTITYGKFLKELLNFFLLAMAVFFIIVKVLHWKKGVGPQKKKRKRRRVRNKDQER